MATDLEQALSQISDIRAQLAASTRFRGYAPNAVGLIGAIGLLLMLAQMAWPRQLAASDRQLVLTWGGLLLAAGLTVAVEAIGRSYRKHGGMADSMLQGAGRIVLPIASACLVIAMVVLVYAPETAWLLPGIWQMLIGVTACASYATMPRAIMWPAIWYLVSGAAVLLLAGRQGALTPAMIGVPLVVGHLGIAMVLRGRGESCGGH